MKVAVFSVQYSRGKHGRSLPSEFRSERRVPLFSALSDCAKKHDAQLAVLPGGFFRSDQASGIARALAAYAPGVSVLVGRDFRSYNKSEAWVVSRNGTITRVIPEAWQAQGGKYNAGRLLEISDRRFQLDGKMYAIYSCGDILIDQRRSPITYSEGAFVLAHYSAPGRSFVPAMQRLGIPTFLSQHVVYPNSPVAVDYSYCGRKRIRAYEQIRGNTEGTSWVARLYSVG